MDLPQCFAWSDVHLNDTVMPFASRGMGTCEHACMCVCVALQATNLADENPDVVARLSTMLMTWSNAQPVTAPSAIVLNPGCDTFNPNGPVTPIGDSFDGLSEFDLS
eukprot:m.89271 g.89271  ORF g.89271 m.89271 type:complete len:107 (-) comp9793_c0_seq1:428-748(-)